jgi:CheY-like chemotaxis protein
MAAPRILLVDDEREVSRMLRSSIELSGWECVVVDSPSGEDALRELGRGPVDLLVADVRLPGISGIELGEKVRQLNPRAKTILITGDPTDEVRESAEKLGVVALLQKPIGTSFFLEAVASALRQTGELPGRTEVPNVTRAKIRELLETLLEELSISMAFVIDDFGRTVALSGEAPELKVDVAIPSLMAASDAGLKVSSLMGALLPANLLYVEGNESNIYLFNVGAFYTLALVHSRERMDELPKIVAAGRHTADELLDLLSSIGIVRTSEAEQDVLEERRLKSPFGEWKVIMPNDKKDEEPAELEEVANTVEKKDADDFWEEAVSDTPKSKESDSDILTYDEALDQGLLPDDD